ncbi:nitrite reductase large subunit NirB [Actinomarinicola tropica]|uniref:assimilatory sulfite reductase (ferredoxin) n=1 Tax=Actinomarinicola tropica TaxID=2789776 RepID=A0A5Q2RP83_9ACTN|nr:nitrite reductase large subunit NirB [Actinomarinicola tropica]QGG96401.1 nitrite reductase large subunit [Actinomarinicola tropica]
MAAPRTRTLVVVGNGMVGQKLVDLVLDGDVDRRWRIVVIGEEPRPAYDRVALSSWFDGRTEHDLSLVRPEVLEDERLDLRVGRTVVDIDTASRFVRLDDGTMEPYDELVLATGSTPFVPPIPGVDLPGCFVYRTIEDLVAIRDRALAGSRRVGAVIGGGLLGLEAANALRLLGLETHVLEMAPHLMPQQLDEPAARMLGRWLDELGVAVHCGVSTTELVGGPDGIRAVRFAEGDDLEVDLVVVSAGVRPRDALGRAAGLEVGERGGVVVDDLCRTSAPSVSAIGEVVCHDGRVHGLVAPGYEMARVVADRLVGEGAARFAPGLPSTKLKLMGVALASFGETRAGEGTEALVLSDPVRKVHRTLVVDSSTGALRGGILVGDTEGYDLLSLMASGDVPTPTDIGTFLSPVSADASPAIGPDALPDAAQICSCNAVTKGAICGSIADGAHTAKEVGACTGAGTGCGGCVPTVNRILHAELDRLGLTVDRRLCEHFDLTRQELYDLVRFHRHTTWAEVRDAHGSGYGCEICRPVVASILASLTGRYVLDGDHASLQDTNDHALANMQRNGTYSVVPRVPGGEITPAQLIELGRIAEDFGLYTKITGGQRIDLFGARLDQLPAIWERVIAAGMESGHAYGKALRTVKSCVGDTWCRYGVQDSVGMAIHVELRYRGLRAPHKIKAAVSGCARECAEARSKDVGVIATEAGWNLYVGGNGGTAPRHAELLAADLDDETLLRYIDRFLMFYVRTADRLQRTAAWIEEMDGGLDHVRAVVVDDVLGIAEELEADMARHVGSYECEWQATLQDPARRARFVEFVNAPEVVHDPGWTEVRGQRVPLPTRREVQV